VRLRLFKANELKRVRVHDFEFHSQRNASPEPFSNESRKERRGRFTRSFRARTPCSLFRNRPCGQRSIPPPTACQQRGTSVLLSPKDDLARPIAILGSRLSRPALTDLALDGGWELADTGLPDIHAGQVIFASMRAASNLSKINIAGRDAAEQPLTLAPETQAVDTDLPKLIWMKHRIDSLLQDGKDSEAIVLAKKANLVCRGAAFVAWDDAEKVAIAQEEVYQLSLSHDGKQMVLLARPRVLERSLGGNPSLYHLRDTAESLEEGYDEELVGGISDLSKTDRLTEQLAITIDSVFYAPDAAELVGIMQDWATHTDEDQVCQALCVLLRECERDRDAGRLRKVLTDFSSRSRILGKQGRVP
jgi:hypothetical protein